MAPTDLHSLKVATYDLVCAVSGIERAAQITGKSASQVARWYAERDEKDPSKLSRTTIDALSIALLEADLAERGVPTRPVTDVLARIGGRRLDDVAAIEGRKSLGEVAAGLGSVFGPLMGALVRGLSDPNVSSTDLRLLEGQARHLMREATDLTLVLGRRVAEDGEESA